ncbi:hypothetical protein PIB30_080059 [Stylosanthes scabra]|uniref:Uncharacterized protein n=1 Tax=Stylosanthes scabra TaxID=79078 RepID=A0ABU6TSM5_9FABA|nr:hypothetical protein [Stylosanthes scabra]
MEFVSQETPGETPSVNNEDQCEEPASAAKEDHVGVETHEEKSPEKSDYVMKAAMPPEKREMADQMLAVVAEVNPRAHFPPTSMVDVAVVPLLDQETYQNAVVARKGPVSGLGTSSGAFTHKIDPTVKGKVASETSQTLKSKGEHLLQPKDSDDNVIIIEPPARAVKRAGLANLGPARLAHGPILTALPPAKLMGSAIAAHAWGRRSGNMRTGQNWQGEVACVKQEPKDAEPEVPDVNTQCRTGLPPIPVATTGNERGTNRQLQGSRAKGGGRVIEEEGRRDLPLIPLPCANMGLDVKAREILFRHDIHDLTRDDLLSLRPRLTPSVVVVNTLALVSSRNVRRRTNATCWFLPSIFVADILRGIVWDNVFVPIWDVDEAWYMMILDVRKPRVYSLDVHKIVDNMARKEKQMKDVGDGDTLRMRLASSIVGAQYNELRPAVDEASQATW